MEIDRGQATGLPAGLVERRAGRCESVRAATTIWRCWCCRRRLSTRDATSTDAGGVKNAAVTSRLFLFPRALFPPDADPSSPASVRTHASARIDRVAPRQRRHDSTTAHSSIIAALPQRTKGGGEEERPFVSALYFSPVDSCATCRLPLFSKINRPSSC